MPVLFFLLLPISAAAQEVDVDVDISACRSMYGVLKAMHDGKPRDVVAKQLDTILATRAYRTMFKHYNRSWRPNHLPEPVFKGMILSLRYEGEYTAGSNERADTMRARWKAYYDDLPSYERKLRRLESANLRKLIRRGVRYAQAWLPPGWTIPKFYFPVVPNGGSPAFTIDDAQGYDFLQLSDDVNWLVGTISHESHHLGMRVEPPAGLTKEEALAFRVVTLTMAEGIATKFISGPPAGRAPALPEVPFHVFTPDLAAAWNRNVADEDAILNHLVTLLSQALADQLTDDALDTEMRDYWLNGAVGRAYVLGSDLFGAIYIAFGKKGLFEVMRDPRLLFQSYNAALDAKPRALRNCVRVPEKAAKQALSIGRRANTSRSGTPSR